MGMAVATAKPAARHPATKPAALLTARLPAAAAAIAYKPTAIEQYQLA
jgi:hypothetical protein